MALTTRSADELNQMLAGAQTALKERKYDVAKSAMDTIMARTGREHDSIRLADAEPLQDEFHEAHIGHSQVDEHVAFRKACDDVFLVASALGYVRSKQKSTIIDPEITGLKCYKALRRRFPKLMEKGMTIAKAARVNKAIYSTGAGVGDEWVPTEHSSELQDAVRLETKVASLFREIRMPTNPYTLPVKGALKEPLLLSEVDADNDAEISKVDPATVNAQLSAVKIGYDTIFSEEVDEDAIVPIVPWLRQEAIEFMAHGRDRAIIDGDTSTTHQDSDITSAASVRKAWMGLRKLALAAAKKDGGTFALSILRNVRAGMGKYAANPSNLVYITSTEGAMRILGLGQFETQEKFGAGASALKGQLTTIDGAPLIVSEEVRGDLNATGVYDGITTTKTLVVVVNRKAFVNGLKRGVTIKPFADTRRDEYHLTTTARWAFKSFFATSTETVCGFAYNIAVTG